MVTPGPAPGSSPDDAGPEVGGTGFVEPAYGVRSLGDVVPAAAAALGVRLPAGTIDPPSGLRLPDSRAIVVFLVDGLGLRLLEAHAHAAPYLSSLVERGSWATAGVPSTTATSLTSLGTGLTPGVHGLVGFSSRIPGTDELLNALTWHDDVDPVEWQPHPTAFSRLRAAGVRVSVVNKREFDGSGLTVAAHRGAEFVGADRVGERIAAVLDAAADGPSLTYVYDGDLDWTGHRWGVASTSWLQQLAMIDAEAEQLRDALPSDVRLVVVADHGMIDVPADDRVDVDDHPDLRDGVALLGGEARFRHLYCRRGAVDDVAAAWTAHLGDRAEVLTRPEAIRRHWFGRVTPAVLPRLGDVVVACRGTTAVVSHEDFPYEARLVGMHGSLTEAEMTIPVLCD